MDCFDLQVLRSRDTLPCKQCFFCSCGVCCFSHTFRNAVHSYIFFVKILNYISIITIAETELPQNKTATWQAAESSSMQNSCFLYKQSAIVLNPACRWMLLHCRLTCESYRVQRATLIYVRKGIQHSQVAFTKFNLHLALY